MNCSWESMLGNPGKRPVSRGDARHLKPLSNQMGPQQESGGSSALKTPSHPRRDSSAASGKLLLKAGAPRLTVAELGRRTAGSSASRARRAARPPQIIPRQSGQQLQRLQKLQAQRIGPQLPKLPKRPKRGARPVRGPPTTAGTSGPTADPGQRKQAATPNRAATPSSRTESPSTRARSPASTRARSRSPKRKGSPQSRAGSPNAGGSPTVDVRAEYRRAMAEMEAEEDVNAVPAHREHEEEERTEATEAPDHFPTGPALEDTGSASRPGTSGSLVQPMMTLDLQMVHNQDATPGSPVVPISFDDAFSFGTETDAAGSPFIIRGSIGRKFEPEPQLDWVRMRPYELKKHCRSRGLAEHGSKATLVARLQGLEKEESASEEQQGASVAAKDPVAEAKAAAMKEAAKGGNVSAIQALLADGVAVDVVDEQGYTPLYCATMYEKEEAVAALLAAGAEVDKENNNGVSPLMAAARDGMTVIVKQLLKAGADFTQIDEFGRTADSIANEKGHPETAAAVTEWAATPAAATAVSAAKAAKEAVATAAAEAAAAAAAATEASSSASLVVDTTLEASRIIHGDEVESPLPMLSSRSGENLLLTPRRRDSVASSSASRQRATTAPQGNAQANTTAQSDRHPGSGRFDPRRRTPSATRRRRRAATRAGKEGRRSVDGRSFSAPSQRDAFFGTAARRAFFSLYREQERQCTQEGDDAIRPDSARTMYLECAMNQTSVPLCRLVVQLQAYNGPVQLEHGRLLRLSAVDATAEIAQVKSQIRDHLHLPVGRQILLHKGVPLENGETVASYGLHRLPPPVLLQLAFEEPEPESQLDSSAAAPPSAADGGISLSRYGGSGGASMLATLAQAYQENEPLARAILQRARTGVEFENPDTGYAKLYPATQLPLPLLIQKDEQELRRLCAELVPEMDHTEAFRACQAAGLPVPATAPLQSMQSALTLHLTSHSSGSDDVEEQNKRVVLKLNAYRMGDSQALAYADGLRSMARQGVQISEVHLNKNWLSADGVAAISAALCLCPRLSFLDIGENRIGSRGSDAIAELLTQHERLSTLRLADCDIGDHCASVLIAMARHKGLTSVDLSSNGIGDMMLRGGNAHGIAELADAIASSIKITSLNLKWNSLRGADAGKVLRGLEMNVALHSINLSWNNLGNAGVCQLGAALRNNQKLSKIDISHCDVGEKGAIVLADSMKENVTVQHLILDDNPIGHLGGRAILRCLCYMVIHKRVELCNISIKRVNLEARDPLERNLTHPNPSQMLPPLFDPQEAGGTHTCNLADPYQRSVANELVELAWTQDGENWENEKLDGKPFNLPEPPDDEIWGRDEFSLPEDGTLEVTYRTTRFQPRMEHVLYGGMFDVLMRLLKVGDPPRLQMVQLASSEFFFNSEHTMEILQLFTDVHSRVACLGFLLHRTVDYVNWCSVIFAELTDNEMQRLEAKLGDLFYFIPCNPTGHYKLNLASPVQRTVVQKIIEISTEEAAFRREYGMIDTSQKGDWDNWRNERLNGAPWDYDQEELKLASSGVLEFDYVSTNLAHRLVDITPIVDAEFEWLMMDLRGCKNMVTVFGTDEDKALQGLQARTRWQVARRAVSTTQLLQATTGGDDAADATLMGSALMLKEQTLSSGKRSAWWIPQQTLRTRIQPSVGAETERSAIVAQRQVRMLRRSTLVHYYTASQVGRMLSVIEPAAHLEALVVLFSRVLDLENHNASSMLTEEEFVEYVNRLGHANTFNPFLPDRHSTVPAFSRLQLAGSTGGRKEENRYPPVDIPATFGAKKYELNLGGHYIGHYAQGMKDERMLCRLLVKLCVEDGENWMNELYNDMPFDLGVKWTEEEPNGPPTSGNVKLEFFTGDNTADLDLRCEMARRLLMPGAGRWRCIPPAKVKGYEEAAAQAEPADFDDPRDMSSFCLDADGTLKSVVAVFQDFDRDHSGFLDESEFRKAMKRMRVRESVIEALWNLADDGGDGQVSLEEFQKVWRNVKKAQSENV